MTIPVQDLISILEINRGHYDDNLNLDISDAEIIQELNNIELPDIISRRTLEVYRMVYLTFGEDALNFAKPLLDKQNNSIEEMLTFVRSGYDNTAEVDRFHCYLISFSTEIRATDDFLERELYIPAIGAMQCVQDEINDGLYRVLTWLEIDGIDYHLDMLFAIPNTPEIVENIRDIVRYRLNINNVDNEPRLEAEDNQAPRLMM